MAAYDQSRHVASDRLVATSATFASCGHPADKTITALDQQSNRVFLRVAYLVQKK
jgi:hypothetical protein